MILSIENTSREVATITAYGDGFVVSPPQEDDHDGIKVYTCPPCDVVAVESAARDIYVEETGSDTTGDGVSTGTAFRSIYKALLNLKPILEEPVNILVGAGQFEWDIDCNNLVNTFTLSGSGELEIIGTYEVISSGLTFSRGSLATGDQFTFTVTPTPAWSDDEQVGRFVGEAGNLTNGFPILKSGADWVHSPRSWGASTNIIFEIKTIVTVAVKNYLTKFFIKGSASFIFRVLDFQCEDRQNPVYQTGTAPAKLITCKLVNKKLNSPLNFGSTIKVTHDFISVYFEINITTISIFTQAFNISNGSVKNSCVNNVGTPTTHFYGVTFITFQEHVIDFSVRNFPYAFTTKFSARPFIDLISGFMALDCGVAFVYAFGGGKFEAYGGWVIVKNTDYVVSSHVTKNVYAVFEDALYGTPLKANMLPEAGDTWNGVSLIANKLPPDQVTDPDKLIFINFPI